MVSVEDAGPGWLLTLGMLTGQFEFDSYCISYCTVLCGRLVCRELEDAV